jgi:integrase
VHRQVPSARLQAVVVALDVTTVDLLRAHRRRCEDDANSLGVRISESGRLFSASPDHSTWLLPSSVTQRYARMCARLGWDRNIHELRHYSATELISAGVDVRAVAGRLGHDGGGTTTLRTYGARVSEADQRAADQSWSHRGSPRRHCSWIPLGGRDD